MSDANTLESDKSVLGVSTGPSLDAALNAIGQTCCHEISAGTLTSRCTKSADEPGQSGRLRWDLRFETLCKS